jgi:two-component sensor histidine kinase
VLRWREHGGPPVTPPEKTGFGTLLIERVLGGDGKATSIEFAADGLVCTLEIDV